MKSASLEFSKVDNLQLPFARHLNEYAFECLLYKEKSMKMLELHSSSIWVFFSSPKVGASVDVHLHASVNGIDLFDLSPFCNPPSISL